MATAAALAAAHDPDPATIGTAAGAAVLVIAGPLVNRYSGRAHAEQVPEAIGEDAQQAWPSEPMSTLASMS